MLTQLIGNVLNNYMKIKCINGCTYVWYQCTNVLQIDIHEWNRNQTKSPLQDKIEFPFTFGMFPFSPVTCIGDFHPLCSTTIYLCYPLTYSKRFSCFSLHTYGLCPILYQMLYEKCIFLSLTLQSIQLNEKSISPRIFQG